MSELLQITARGLYCADGDFYIDPWKSVERAVITHAHSDHARPGSKRYLCSRQCAGVLRLRVGMKAAIDSLEYGEAISLNGVKVSLHPAGHILGSSQIRVERNGETIVVSGDYKSEPDGTCATFEPIKCQTFITESTFGLPIYRWQPDRMIFAEINNWWRSNQGAGRASVLLGYSLGKSQRALHGLDPGIGPIYQHASLQPYTDAYRDEGIIMPVTRDVESEDTETDWSRAMILAPPGVTGTPWMNRFGDYATAFMSGWMAIRSARNRGGVDRGFVLSDHVDWPSLLQAISDTGAERVLVTHGFTTEVVRYLCGQGLDARLLETAWSEEQSETA